MKMTRMFFLFLVGLLVCPMIGQGVVEAKSQYVMVYYVVGAEVWGPARQGATDAAKHYGVDVSFKGPIEFDPAAQARVMDELIAMKPSGITIWPADPGALRDAINRAIDAGIPVICCDSDSPGSKRLCRIGTNNYQAGRNGGDFFGSYLVKKFGTTGTIEVGFSGMIGNTFSEDRVRGYRDIFREKYPNIKDVGYVNDKSDISVGIQVQTALLNAQPNLKAFIGLDGMAGASIVRALKESGRQGKVEVMAMDQNKDTVEGIRDGSIVGSVVQKLYLVQFLGITLLNDMNASVFKMWPRWREAGFSMAPIPRDIDTGTIIVTKSNVETLLKVK